MPTLATYITRDRIDTSATATASASVSEAVYSAPAPAARQAGNNSYLYAAMLAVVAAIIIWIIFFKK